MENIFSQSLKNNFKRLKPFHQSVTNIIPPLPSTNFLSQVNEPTFSNNEKYENGDGYENTFGWEKQSDTDNIFSQAIVSQNNNKLLYEENDEGFYSHNNLTVDHKSRREGFDTFENPEENFSYSQHDFSPSNQIMKSIGKTNHMEATNGVEKLRSVKEIPKQYQQIFPFQYFNSLQSKVLDEVLYTDNPIVVCSPTGSGKTVVFELCIIRLLLHCGDNNAESVNYKVIYMAPIKALCSERFEDWSNKFSRFGLKCVELTGDTEVDDYQTLHMSNIVFTTPEKWDSMTRKWKDNKQLIQSVRLFLIDEVHLLNDNTRGATMEAVVSRMKTVQVSIKNESTIQSDLTLRFVAISATIPNVKDIASWLDTGILPSISFNLGEEYRPVQLRKVVLGYPCSPKQTDFKFDFSLNYKLSNIIQTYAENKPSLIFCCTRKGVAQTAGIIVKDARFIINHQHRERLKQYSNMLHDHKLQEYVIQGVGFHHAGLDSVDRKLIEDVFTRGDLPVLCCTSTLAMGVNLPAHLVVIKGTMHYVMGSYVEYSETQLLQMMGRAGRPQFDTSATAVIMTKTHNKGKYEAMVSGKQSIESSLHHHLTEHINAEVVLGTITSYDIAKEWLKSTFLCIRMQENPKYYGVPGSMNKDAVSKTLQGISNKALQALQSFNLLNISNEGALVSTELGKLMARYCVAFETVKMLSECKGKESMENLLAYLSKSREFTEISLRQNEKKTLNSLNKDKNHVNIRYPMKSRIKSCDQKINCLIQASLGCLNVNDFSLMQDTTKIMRVGQRVARFMMEFFFNMSLPSFQSSLNSTLLYKNIRAKLWDDSFYVSKQIEKIGPALSTALVNANLTSFKKIGDTNPRELEMIMNRNPPFGSQIKEYVNALPKYDVTVNQIFSKKIDTAELNIKVEILNRETRKAYLKSKKQHYQQGCILIVGDANNNVLLRNKLSDSQLLENTCWSKRFFVNSIQNKSNELSVNLISLDYVGLDVRTSFKPEYHEIITQSNISHDMDNRHYHGNMYNKQQTGFNDNTQSPYHFPVYDQHKDDEHTVATCAHKCFNKLKCGHNCCKSMVKPSKLKGKQDMNSDNAMSSSKGHQRNMSRPAVRTPLNKFRDEMERRKTDLPYVQPFKKIKVELTLGTNGYNGYKSMPSKNVDSHEKRLFSRYAYNSPSVYPSNHVRMKRHEEETMTDMQEDESGFDNVFTDAGNNDDDAHQYSMLSDEDEPSHVINYNSGISNRISTPTATPANSHDAFHSENYYADYNTSSNHGDITPAGLFHQPSTDLYDIKKNNFASSSKLRLHKQPLVRRSLFQANEMRMRATTGKNYLAKSKQNTCLHDTVKNTLHKIKQYNDPNYIDNSRYTDDRIVPSLVANDNVRNATESDDEGDDFPVFNLKSSKNSTNAMTSFQARPTELFCRKSCANQDSISSVRSFVENVSPKNQAKNVPWSNLPKQNMIHRSFDDDIQNIFSNERTRTVEQVTNRGIFEQPRRDITVEQSNRTERVEQQCQTKAIARSSNIYQSNIPRDQMEESKSESLQRLNQPKNNPCWQSNQTSNNPCCQSNQTSNNQCWQNDIFMSNVDDELCVEESYEIDDVVTSSENKRNERSSGDMRSGDMRSADMRSGDMRSGDMRSGDMRSGDMRSEDMRSGDMRSGDMRSRDMRECFSFFVEI